VQQLEEHEQAVRLTLDTSAANYEPEKIRRAVNTIARTGGHQQRSQLEHIPQQRLRCAGALQQRLSPLQRVSDDWFAVREIRDLPDVARPALNSSAYRLALKAGCREAPLWRGGEDDNA
jgi:hypothetical protein